MSDTPERFVLARRGLPLPLASHATLRGSWLPAAARNDRAPDRPRSPQAASPPPPAETGEDEPWWMEASERVPATATDRVPASLPMTPDRPATETPFATRDRVTTERDRSGMITHIVQVPMWRDSNVPMSNADRRAHDAKPVDSRPVVARADGAGLVEPTRDPILPIAPATPLTSEMEPAPSHTIVHERRNDVETRTVVIEKLGGAPASRRKEELAKQNVAIEMTRIDDARPIGHPTPATAESRQDGSRSVVTDSRAMGVPRILMEAPRSVERPDLTPLLTTPRRGDVGEITIDRIAVTVQTPTSRSASPPAQSAASVASPVAPAARPYRNPWSSYFVRRD